MANRQYFFAPFRLDAINQELFRNEERLRLRPKTFAVLLYLIERAGQLVGKDELLEKIWPDSETVDSSLKVSIGELRKVFGDDRGSPVWIETRKGIGYRFLRTVTRGSAVKLEVEDWYGLQERGFTVERRTMINSKLAYDNIEGLTEASGGTPEQWIASSYNNPDGRSYLLADGQLCGYWHFEFVGPELYERIRAGQLDDHDLTADKVRRPCEPDTYDIYVVCVLVDKKFRGIDASRLLYESLMNRIFELRAKGIVIDRIIANAFTSEGVSMCRSFGLTEVGPHKEEGIIFEGRLSEHPRFAK